MKKISKYLLLLAVAVFTFTACENNPQREPSPEDSPLAVSFTNGGETVKLNMAKEPLEKIVALHRTCNLDKADTIKVTVVEADPVFVIDPVFIFAPGDKEVAHKVTFATGEADSTYTFKLELPGDKVSPYLAGHPTFEYTVTLELWSEPAFGVFVEQTVGPAFGLGVNAWFVEYQTAENPDGSMRFRMINPYASFATAKDADGIYDGNPWTEDGDVDESQDYNFVLNISAEGEVTFPDLFTFLGIGWGNYLNQFFVDYARGTGAAGTYGRFDKEKSKIVFDAQDNSILFGAYKSTGERSIYGIQANFVFYLSKAAYLADQEEPVVVDADVTTYEGNWQIKGFDITIDEEDVPVSANVKITSYDDPTDGQYYVIEGLYPTMPEVYGSFDEETHKFKIEASQGDPVEINEKTYVPVLYLVNTSWSPSAQITLDIIPGEGGTLVTDEASEAIGFRIRYINPSDQSDAFWGDGMFDISFEPGNVDGAPARKAPAKRSAKKSNKRLLMPEVKEAVR